MKKMFVFFIIGLLSGCQSTSDFYPENKYEKGMPVSLSIRQITMVKNGVKAHLKDPVSAQFGNISASKDSKGQIYVCGLVNAKNSFGGYTGSKPFNGLLAEIKPGIGMFGVTGMGGTEIETSVVFRFCNAWGISQF